MLRLVLLDDEEIVLKGMRKVYHFEEYGFEVVGTYQNPIHALQHLDEDRPDLIVTDIKMPFMNGLEFAQKAIELMPEVDIVILSGYEDFSFAQTAVKLGIRDYLLKPIRKKDFQGMLEKAHRKIKEKKQKSSYYESLQKNAQENYQEIKEKVLSELAEQVNDKSNNEINHEINGVPSKIVRSAIDYMQAHYSENISLAEVAKQIHISKNYLSDLFRKDLNISFINYLTNLRLEKAKEYLTESDMKMYEISAAVGYTDYTYFSSLFKKHTGKTLSEYRRLHELKFI